MQRKDCRLQKMETWFLLIIVTACLASTALKAFLSTEPKPKLPPGPQGIPIISSIKWLNKSLVEITAALKSLQIKFGPIISIPMGTLSVFVVLDHDLAHQALVQKGAIFADRPMHLSPAVRQPSSILLAMYGPTWRILRRNLTCQILHASRLKEYSHSRKKVLESLLTRLGSAGYDSPVMVVDHFQFAVFCALFHMCFGGELEETEIRAVEAIQREFLESVTRFQMLNFWPRLTRILLWKRWEEFFSLRKRQQEVLRPFVRPRKGIDANKSSTSYVDTLLNLEIHDDDIEGGGKRKLTEEELIIACLEFLSAGTDTTLTALQWIMANLVKYPDIQDKLFDEIRGVIGLEAEQVGEQDLPNMPYLRAVVLEGLRRHPPFYFVMPHSVTEDVELGGYILPKNAVVNFTIALMGWDPMVWEDPMEFNPERFVSIKGSDDHIPTEIDITGSRKIKMMPFGAGRRICPGLGLAILLLEYLVANLVWKFEWATVKGHEVDLSEKQEFTVVMKHPLHAYLSPRNLQIQ